jgi:molybdopterin-guanine dinucleotide biosynthesis protein A
MRKFGTAVILAGGKSSRMGFDKQFLNINKKGIINIIISKLEKEFDDIIIVTNKPDEYKNYRQKIITDILENMGPLGGIHSGLKAASSEYSFVIACDMPNVDIEYVRYMKNAVNSVDADICVTRIGNNIEPLYGFYSLKTAKDIEKYLSEGKRAVAPLIKKLNTKYIGEKEYNREGLKLNTDIFINLNTQKDLADYLSKIKG